jgi:hypothetical protein
MLLFSRHPFAVRIDVGVSSENPRHWVQGQLPASRATIRVAHGNARTPGQRTDVPIGADRTAGGSFVLAHWSVSSSP